MRQRHALGGEAVRLTALRGKPVVVYFFPQDETRAAPRRRAPSPTFPVDHDGKVAHVWPFVAPGIHAREVIAEASKL